MAQSEYKIALKNIYISFGANLVSLIITIIITFLLNQFAGTSNFGIYSIAISLIPYATLVLSSIDTLTVYRLYKPLAQKNYVAAQTLMSRSLYEYRTRGMFSFFGLLLMSVLFPIIFGSDSVFDGVLNGLTILAGGVSSLFAFLISPIYQKILVVERKGYLLQIFDLIGRIIFNSIFVAIIFTNFRFQYLGNNKWLIVFSTFVSNFTVSFSVFLAFVLRKKIAPWFKNKMNKNYIEDAKIRRQLTLDAFISQLILNTSFLTFAIYNNFSSDSSVLAGIYGNYLLAKSALSLIMTTILNTVINSLARVYHTSEKKYLIKVYDSYDYVSFMGAVFSFTTILIISPFFSSLNTTQNSFGVANSLSSLHGFNQWLGFLMGLAIFIEVARLPAENLKNIQGHYGWKVKFASIEATINIIITIVGVIISYYFPWLNGLGIIASLILAVLLSTGFRYISVKLSSIKSLYESDIFSISIRKVFFHAFLPIIIGLVYTGGVISLIPFDTVSLRFTGSGILTLFLVGLIALFLIVIILFVLVFLKEDFRKLFVNKFKFMWSQLKNKKS
ncbi:hypothetical protein [[Mycoplasma] testudinis]|uniref:hypothetical protein n=1 Tax=[Mycoplasma] testudinis TaxID=33924 RepID=UPI0004886F59|nr:hypothetical protein [[Mycoplasma] testudinis]